MNKVFLLIICYLISLLSCVGENVSKHFFKIKEDEIEVVGAKKRSLKLPGKISEIGSLSIHKEGKELLVLAVKCNVGKLEKWYFLYEGFFGSSNFVELGVQPPVDSSLKEIKWLSGDSFLIIFDSSLQGDLRYFTSCPPSSGKDSIGGAFGFNPSFLDLILEDE
jgi:hypothetical protein